MEVNHHHQPRRSSWKMDSPNFRTTHLSALSRNQAGLSLLRSSRPSLYRERLGQYRGESTLYTSDSTYLMSVQTTKNDQSSNWRRCRGRKFFCVFVCQHVQCMTRSSTDPLYAFDPEIEFTLRRLRKIRNTAVKISSSIKSVTDSNQFYTDTFVSSSNIFAESEQMENNDRTLKELATPDVVYQPWCIQYPQLEPAQTYELKSGLIHLLPKFHGLVGEDPHKHLKEFHVVCSTMRPQGISEDYIKMKAFPFSLDGAAKDWLYL
ncbi:hypothetical protein CR513_23214, partial [Mucuna pruriens]